MTRTISFLSLAFLVGCSAEESVPEPPPPPPPPPTIADFAGDWRFYFYAESEGAIDTVMSTISGVGGSNWMMFLADRDPISLTPTLRGDSLILTSDKFPSVRRENTPVQLRVAAILTEAGMEGNTLAAYDTPDGQEIVTGTARGNRP